jgi:hypothetical protein
VLLPNGNDCWIEENDRGLSVDPLLAWGNGGGAGSMRARPSHRRTDCQPSREKRLGCVLRRPSWGPTYSHLRRNFFCKIGSASASKMPQRSRSGIYLTFSTTESTAFTGCTEGTARIPSERQRHATSRRNQCGFVCTKKKLRTKSAAFDPKGPWTKKLVVGARPITLALEADRRIRIGADHLAFRRYHGGARRSLRQSGLGVVCTLLCRHGSRYQRSRTDNGQQNLQIRIHNQSNLVASPLRPE